MSTNSKRATICVVRVAIVILIAGLCIAPLAIASLTPSWITEGNQPGALYGGSVARAGDVDGDGYGDVIVGASGYYQYLFGYPGNARGRAYLYSGSASGLSTTPSWTAEGTADNQFFGHVVATAGDVNGDGYRDVVVGRAHSTSGGQAWVFYGSASGLPATASWTQTGPQGYGDVVAGAGDVNGDGYADIIVGNDLQSGQSYVYHGSAGGLSTSPALVAWMGNGPVACAGDMNADGYSDVVIGHVSGQSGSAQFFLGSPTGLSGTPARSFSFGPTQSHFGTSVAGVGDVNGDGYDDVLVGADLFDFNNLTDTGRIFLYLGSAGVPDAFPDWAFSVDQTSAQIGNSVAGAGDVNGDGYDDVLVGAWRYNYAQADQGRAYLFFGSALGFASAPDWVATGDQAYADFGVSVAGAGDVNGDGGADLLVGAWRFQDPDVFEGRAYLFTTSVVGVPHRPAVTGLALAPPFPNPSRDVTDLAYSLPASGRARLAVYDVTGRPVAFLVDGIEAAGPHTARWESGGRVPSGVYVVRLEFAGRVETRRIAVTR